MKIQQQDNNLQLVVTSPDFDEFERLINGSLHSNQTLNQRDLQPDEFNAFSSNSDQLTTRNNQLVSGQCGQINYELTGGNYINGQMNTTRLASGMGSQLNNQLISDSQINRPLNQLVSSNHHHINNQLNNQLLSLNYSSQTNYVDSPYQSNYQPSSDYFNHSPNSLRIVNQTQSVERDCEGLFVDCIFEQHNLASLSRSSYVNNHNVQYVQINNYHSPAYSNTSRPASNYNSLPQHHSSNDYHHNDPMLMSNLTYQDKNAFNPSMNPAGMNAQWRRQQLINQQMIDQQRQQMINQQILNNNLYQLNGSRFNDLNGSRNQSMQSRMMDRWYQSNANLSQQFDRHANFLNQHPNQHSDALSNQLQVQNDFVNNDDYQSDDYIDQYLNDERALVALNDRDDLDVSQSDNIRSDTSKLLGSIENAVCLASENSKQNRISSNIEHQSVDQSLTLNHDDYTISNLNKSLDQTVNEDSLSNAYDDNTVKNVEEESDDIVEIIVKDTKTDNTVKNMEEELDDIVEIIAKDTKPDNTTKNRTNEIKDATSEQSTNNDLPNIDNTADSDVVDYKSKSISLKQYYDRQAMKRKIDDSPSSKELEKSTKRPKNQNSKVATMTDTNNKASAITNVLTPIAASQNIPKNFHNELLVNLFSYKRSPCSESTYERTQADRIQDENVFNSVLDDSDDLKVLGQGCQCVSGCISSGCACYEKGLNCSTTSCSCTEPCSNPFYLFNMLNLNIDKVKLDQCLMQNLPSMDVSVTIA